MRHPQTQGKVERFHGTLEHALEKRGALCEHLQQWLDAYRCEHNHVRPHMALRMRTPATLWRKSQRRYDPNPPEWQYPQGTRTLKVDCQGTIDIKANATESAKPWLGNACCCNRVQPRWLVFYFSNLVREIHPAAQCSTIVERWVKQPT